MKPEQMFRRAAMESKQVQWLGPIVLLRPLSFSFMTTFGALCALALVLFFACASYTRRNTVTGQLVPDGGLIKVHVQQTGVVVKKMVSEGQAVRQGDVLFVLSYQQQGVITGDTQASISGQVAQRQASLREELARTAQLQVAARKALQAKVDGLLNEQSKVLSQLEGQKARVSLAEAALARTQELVASNYISKEQLQLKQGDLLDQRNRTQALERDALSVQRERTSLQDELANLPLQQRMQLAQLERLINVTGQELTESEAKRGVLITAPASGTVSALLVDSGQVVDPSRPLLTLVPDGARVHAELYVPSRSIGFIRRGSPVLLRYQAYPFQKFGHGRGRVSMVSKTALSSADLSGRTAPPANGEPLYKVTVELAAQSVLAYGQDEKLQVGMQLDADVLQETRPLYEWVLEPLFSLTGKL
jgi:membrane fusion protein